MNKIIIVENGPAVISAEENIELVFGQETQVGKKFALCRCGYSSNGILCDGSHQNYSREK